MPTFHQYRYYKELFSDQLRMIRLALTERIIPSFESIGDEATNIADRYYQDAASLPGYSEYFDGSQISSEAFSIGSEHYELNSSIRQGIINMMAAAQYHLFEQQVFRISNELLQQKISNKNKNAPSKTSLTDYSEAFKSGLGIALFESNEKSWLNEMRLIANTVKHGHGESSTDLRKVNPELFIEEFELALGIDFSTHRKTIMPLFGDGVYVKLNDIERYENQLCAIWEKFFDALISKEKSTN